ncbi:S41 family peptidase [Butyrivibrio proteoclasticus]|uniref:S41 family peptidase n=1 Tax=Butyrivibrio proteoclasticus TaxID=43305 RepID=UPI00047B26A0|nr:S41 family peptidase [Butyrivibrio proteoclasticus]
MTYTQIFDDIIKIMKEDSATCKDFGAGPYEEYQSKITDDMDRMEFMHLVQEYLATFKVEGHLNFSDGNLGSIGFSVMRKGDELYVIEAKPDTKLSAGDRITHIDGQPIPEIATKESRFFMGESEERQGKTWPAVLKFYNTLSVLHKDGTKEDIAIIHGSKGEEEERYFFKEYDDNTLYIRLADFVDLNAIGQVYADCKDALDKCKKLILDVRGNGGGADSGFEPLLEYCFPEGKLVTDYYKMEYPIEINYSTRNCTDRIELLKNFFGDNVPEDMAPMLERMIADNKENMGKGFIESTEEFAVGIKGRALPEKVFVITDEKCASSGDAFAEVMSYSPKVTLVGRPSMGITDYSNCTMVHFDDFTLLYPTSRDTRIDCGKELSQKGVPVDKYIPWSPENIGKDPELDYCLKKTTEA